MSRGSYISVMHHRPPRSHNAREEKNNDNDNDNENDNDKDNDI